MASRIASPRWPLTSTCAARPRRSSDREDLVRGEVAERRDRYRDPERDAEEHVVGVIDGQVQPGKAERRDQHGHRHLGVAARPPRHYQAVHRAHQEDGQHHDRRRRRGVPAPAADDRGCRTDAAGTGRNRSTCRAGSSTKNRLPRKTSRCRQRRKTMVSTTTDRPTAVTPQPKAASLIPLRDGSARASAPPRAGAGTRCWPGPRARATGCGPRTGRRRPRSGPPAPSQAVVLIVNGCGRGGGAPVGRRWRGPGRGRGGPGQRGRPGWRPGALGVLRHVLGHGAPRLGSAVPAPRSAPTPSAHHALAGAPRLGAGKRSEPTAPDPSASDFATDFTLQLGTRFCPGLVPRWRHAGARINPPSLWHHL